jgi:ketosteroid isomerase-like protein
MEATEVELLGLERAFWEASSTGDGQFYLTHVTRDALYVFPGPVGVLSRDECARVVAENHTPWHRFQIEKPRFVRLSDDHRLLTYTARARPHDAEALVMRVTSIYRHEPDGWKLAFHQQTMAPSES